MENIQEKEVKDYTEATSVSMEKMLGQGGVRFYEFKTENGVTESISHVALPILIDDHPVFYDLLGQIEEIRIEGEMKQKRIQAEIEKMTNDMAGKTEEELTVLEALCMAKVKDMREINRNYFEAITKKRLEVAYLCFKRSEDTTVKKLSRWISNDILNNITNLALGITIPPKQ
jgi:hypothetical protein